MGGHKTLIIVISLGPRPTITTPQWTYSLNHFYTTNLQAMSLLDTGGLDHQPISGKGEFE